MKNAGQLYFISERSERLHFFIRAKHVFMIQCPAGIKGNRKHISIAMKAVLFLRIAQMYRAEFPAFHACVPAGNVIQCGYDD